MHDAKFTTFGSVAGHGPNAPGDPPALLRNSIDGHQVESEFSGLGVKPC